MQQGMGLVSQRGQHRAVADVGGNQGEAPYEPQHRLPQLSRVRRRLALHCRAGVAGQRGRGAVVRREACNSMLRHRLPGRRQDPATQLAQAYTQPAAS